MSNKRTIILLFAIGLLIRILLIGTHSSSDIYEFIRWGKNTYESGLAKSFEGGYFPIQYLILGGSYGAAEKTGLNPEYALKISNLIFEIGIILLITRLLTKYLTTEKILFLFWLNPFALIIFQQGYVDAQFAFFILLSIFIIEKEISGEKRKFILAGIPLGISLLMKPQTAPLFIGLIILAVILFFLKKRIDGINIILIFIVPIILYIFFSMFLGFTIDIKKHKTLTTFSEQLHEKTGLSKRTSEITASSLSLTAEYFFVITKRLPSLSANMPNGWFFVALAHNKKGVPLYRISDNLKLFGVSYRIIGSLFFISIASTLLYRIAKADFSLSKKIIFSLVLIPILMPYLTTSAHENHFYLGFIGSIILGAFLRNSFILAIGYTLSVLNGFVIAFYYLFPYYLKIYPSSISKIPVVFSSALSFFALLYYLFFNSTFKNTNNQKTTTSSLIQ